MNEESDGKSDEAPASAVDALQDRLDKTGLVPKEPQGFDAEGFGGYLLPYAGLVVGALLLAGGAFARFREV